MVDLGLSASRSDDHVVTSDLTYRPVPPNFRATPPRNMLNQIFWVRQEVSALIQPSGSTAIETNFAWTASAYMQQVAQYTAIFDQYYLHSVVATFANSTSFGTTAVLPQLFTAIDFDNITALGTTAAISAFSTCNIDVLKPGNSVTRIIMPCVRTIAETVQTAAVSRLWISTAATSIPFFGLRTITAPSTAGNIDVTLAMIWAFRNTI